MLRTLVGTGCEGQGDSQVTKGVLSQRRRAWRTPPGQDRASAGLGGGARRSQLLGLIRFRVVGGRG